MKITKEQLKELQRDKIIEIRIFECGKEYWDTLELI